ncbi:MAG: HEAT repeat domain-containing protein [Phycisphaerales bacterium]|nr:HEAT repeat domain-containing protein [Phycisphaerales bacterium]
MFRRTQILLTALLGCLLLPLSAVAQTLPAPIISSQSLDDQARQQLEQFVNAHMDRIASDDFQRRRDGRRALLAPLQDPSATTAFRLAYSRIATPTLETLTDSDDPSIALGALMVLGRIATDDSVDTLLLSLRNGSPAVRYGAVNGLRQTFDVQVSAVPPATLWKAVRRLAASLREETDPFVTRAVIRALRASPNPTAGVELCRALSRRLSQPISDKEEARRQRMHSFLLDAYQEAIKGLLEDVTDPTRTHPDLLLATAEVSARTMVWCVCLHEIDPESAEEHLGTLLEAAEVLLLTVHLNLAEETLRQELAGIVQRPGWPGALDAVKEWVGPNNRLTNAPYGFQSEHFTAATCLE